MGGEAPFPPEHLADVLAAVRDQALLRSPKPYLTPLISLRQLSSSLEEILRAGQRRRKGKSAQYTFNNCAFNTKYILHTTRMRAWRFGG